MITWGRYRGDKGDVFTIFCVNCREKLKENAEVSELRAICDDLEVSHKCKNAHVNEHSKYAIPDTHRLVPVTLLEHLRSIMVIYRIDYTEQQIRAIIEDRT